MTENERDKIIERVRKLLALAANNPSETEAASAAEKAQRILIEHNLQMAEVKDAKTNDEEEFEIVPVSETDSHPWRRFLGAAVAELFFCKYFFATKRWYPSNGSGNKLAKDVHTFIGARHNIAVAAMMFEYLHKTVNRLAKDGAKSNPNIKPSQYRTTFRSSATVRLCQRIKDKIRLAKSGGLKTESGQNLPACLDMYEHAAAKADAALGAAGKALTMRKFKLSNQDNRAWADGYDAADKIGLDGQVGQSKQKRIDA